MMGRDLLPFDFPFVMQRPWDNAHTSENIKEAFREGGLVPLNPQHIVDRFLPPSLSPYLFLCLFLSLAHTHAGRQTVRQIDRQADRQTDTRTLHKHLILYTNQPG